MNQRTKILALVIVAVVLIGGWWVWNFTKSNSPCPSSLESSEVNMANPSAVYCESLGYEYKIKDSERGQVSYCVFPNGEECPGWDFFQGKCGEKWSYCEKHGGKIRTTSEGCTYSQECGLCVLPHGTKCREWDYCSGNCP